MTGGEKNRERGEGRAATRTVADLAVFGGDPLFIRPRTTGQLANRDPARFFALAGRAFAERRLTNQGPLVDELERRLAEMHGTDHCISFANACFALLLALRATARPGARTVVLPSLTFRGLPHVIRWAGLQPRFCDVEPVSHTLDPDLLAEQLDDDTAAILAVDNASALCDIDRLEATAEAAGVPLLLDSVYGTCGNYGDSPVGARGRASIFSLHATKLINGFEGGYLTTNDGDLAAALRSQRTFGFDDDGTPTQLGLNAKLNELHAAMALSNLPHLQAIIADNARRFDAYVREFADIPWVSFADYRRGPPTYSLVLLRLDRAAPVDRAGLVRILRAENALVRPYYSPSLHRTDTASPYGDSLPVSDRVSGEFIQMPVGDLVSVSDICRLGALFRMLNACKADIADRLGSTGP